MNQDVISCPACARRTAAARGRCIYCGESLPVTNIAAAPPQRNLEPFEMAFNAVMAPSRPANLERAEAALAGALGIELGTAQAIIGSGLWLPAARCQTQQEAEMISALINGCGLRAVVVPDADLRLETELIRARRVELLRDAVRVHHFGGAISVASSDIVLIVAGGIRSIATDYIETSRGQNAGVLDASQYYSGESLLDIYATTLERSFRIRSDNFDYSGIVSPLSIRAEVNFTAAVSALREAAPQSGFDDRFSQVSPLLSRAWPERSQVNSRGVKRAGLSYRPVASSSIVSDNRDQFDRYSRLRWVMNSGLRVVNSS